MQRWIHTEKDRYYLVDLVEDLLGDWTLVLCWGAIGSQRGRLRVIGVASEAEGLAQMDGVARRRRQRGYWQAVVSGSHRECRDPPCPDGRTTADGSAGDD